MSLPSGILTTTVTYGKSYDVLGANVDVTVRITPSHRLLWEATGDYINDFDVTSSAEAGVVGSFTLVRDQPGFRDGSGNAIRDWYYTAVVTEKRGATVKQYRKVFSITADQEAIDLDALPIDAVVQPPGSAPVPAVTSVNGEAGAVVIELPDVEGLLPAAQKGAASGIAPLDGASRVPQANLPAHLTPTNLEGTFVRFVDENGDPLPAGSITTIHVNTVTGEIDDITFEEA